MYRVIMAGFNEYLLCQSDFQFKNVMTDFEEDFQSRLGSDHTKYIKDIHTPDVLKYLELGGKAMDRGRLD